MTSPQPLHRLSPPTVIPAFPTGRHSGFPHWPSFRLSPLAVIPAQAGIQFDNMPPEAAHYLIGPGDGKT